MQVTETLNEGLKREFDCVIAAAEISEKVDAKLQEIAPTMRLPGFRPGKVPMKVLRQRFGKSVSGEVIDEVVRTGIQSTMDDRNLRPAEEPKIENVEYADGADFKFRLKAEVLPEIAAMDFATLELEKLEPEIPDSEVDEALQRMAESRRDRIDVTEARPAADGDVVVIDFVGSVDGEEFPGGAADGYELALGSGQFIPGFEEQLVGLNVGDEKTVTVTFPEDYGAEHLAGKEASFAVTLKGLKELGPAEVNEALAEKFGAESLDDLRRQMRETMEREYAEVGRNKLKRELFDLLDKAHVFPLPETLVDLEFDGIWREVEQQLQGDEAEDVRDGKSDDELRAEYRTVAERRVRLGLLLSEVGRQNNIAVSPQDLQTAVARQAAQYPGQEEMVQKFYMENPQMLGQLQAPILEDKVVDYILELAKVEVRKLPPSELLEAVQEAEKADDAAAAEAAG
ncbi:MAG: trigger factor [Alphaproteobacteria bacterium]|nr:trigger factor [Alphaproteobacteria bacterium]